MITHKQRLAFFKLFARACDVQGIPAAERETYRHSLIKKAVPASHGSLKAINSGADFDNVMLALAHAAHDFDASQKYVTATGHRLAKMAEALVRQISTIVAPQSRSPRPLCRGTLRAGELISQSANQPITYITSILKQAHFPTTPDFTTEGWWLDCSTDHLQKLIQMLDTHRRRLLRKIPQKLEWSPQRKAYINMRVTFQMDAIYEWHGKILYKRTPSNIVAPQSRSPRPLCRGTLRAGENLRAGVVRSCISGAAAPQSHLSASF